MHKGRLEAFSDGVIAIVITIMVLELHPPHGTDLATLAGVVPSLLAYVLSFVFVGIYWTNHHHMLQLVSHVTGGILWANLHLLFWLSLVPVATAWLGRSHLEAVPVAVYGLLLDACGAAYTILTRTIIASQGPGSRLAAAVGRDRKGWISLLLYTAGVGAAFVAPVVSVGLYVTVAVIWLVPDRRIERHLAAHGPPG